MSDGVTILFFLGSPHITHNEHNSLFCGLCGLCEGGSSGRRGLEGVQPSPFAPVGTACIQRTALAPPSRRFVVARRSPRLGLEVG